MLGHNDKWTGILCGMQIRFEGGSLCLAASLADDDTAVDRATAALLHLWRFRPWSDSRWCGVGASSRALLGCLLCGMESLVSDIMKDPDLSKYHIRGFTRLSPRAKKMMVLVSCCGRVSEHFVEAVLQDDRLPMRIAAIDEQMSKDVRSVQAIPDPVYVLFSGLCGSTAPALRDEVAEMTLTQAGYIQARLREVRLPPWSLVGGDVSAKLQRFRDGPPPTEQTSLKLFKLLRMGVSEPLLMQGIQMLSECPWTTKLVEQPHASVKSLMSAHSMYGVDTMMARAMIMQSRPLFTRDSDETKTKTIRLRVARLRSRQPQRITGRHVYLRSLSVTAALQRKHGKTNTKGVHVKLVRDNMKMWGQLTEMEKRHYDELAVALRCERQTGISGKIRCLMAEVKKLEERFHRRHAGAETSWRMGLCRLSLVEKAAFDELYYSDRFSREAVVASRAAAVAEVGPPCDAEIKLLESMPIFRAPRHSTGDAWVPWLASNRSMMKRSILRIVTDGGVQYAAFAYASQNPMTVCACKLDVVETIDQFVEPQDLFHGLPNFFEHRFEVSWEFAYSDGDLFAGARDLALLLHSTVRSDGRVYVDGDWSSISHLQQVLPMDLHVAGDRTTAPPSAKTPVDVGEPWVRDPAMWEFVLERVLPSEQNVGKGAEAVPEDSLGGDSASSDDDDGDDIAFDAKRALVMRRQELAEACAMEPDPFFWNLRGGHWTAANRGVAYDSYRACARTGSPARFCELHRLPRSATFSIARYSEAACLSLVQLWIHRMTFLYECWFETGSDAPLSFSPERIARYQVPPELEAQLAAFPELTRRRAGEVRALLP